ncbi:MAG: hypothetical protein ACF8GE_00760 [Phycisphaerales bacterium JB043]
MTSDELRLALGELTGERNAVFAFEHADTLRVSNAFLVPDEGDGLVKVSDGSLVYIVDAPRVAWIQIGTNSTLSS